MKGVQHADFGFIALKRIGGAHVSPTKCVFASLGRRSLAAEWTIRCTVIHQSRSPSLDVRVQRRPPRFRRASDYSVL